MSEFKDIKDLGIFFTIDGKGHSFVGIRPNKDGFSDDFLTSEKQFALMISYIAKEKMLHQELSKIFNQSILRIKSDLKKNNQSTISIADKIL